jgi:hypothetical protein
MFEEVKELNAKLFSISAHILDSMEFREGLVLFVYF